jgi:uncharacterized SAM-binding protein YcdF (DUF218 family)
MDDSRRILLNPNANEQPTDPNEVGPAIIPENPKHVGHASKFSQRKFLGFWQKTGVGIGIVFILFLICGLTDINVLLSKPLIEQGPLAPADALVILGGGINSRTGLLSFKTEERVRSGARIFSQGFAPLVVVTGGKVGENTYAEAPAMAQLLQKLGVVENQIVQEDQAQNTLENAQNVMAIARERNWQKLIILTSDFHTSRACTFFRRDGAEVICRAADRSTVEQHTFSRRIQSTFVVLREYAANIYYSLKGKR